MQEAGRAGRDGAAAHCVLFVDMSVQVRACRATRSMSNVSRDTLAPAQVVPLLRPLSLPDAIRHVVPAAAARVRAAAPHLPPFSPPPLLRRDAAAPLPDV